MTALTFDTHLFVKRLRDTGVPEAQAEAIIDVVRDASAQSLYDSANKADIRDVKTELREMELRMDSRFKDIQIRLGGMIIGLGGVLIAVKYFG